LKTGRSSDMFLIFVRSHRLYFLFREKLPTEVTAGSPICFESVSGAEYAGVPV
jgi:hypothetical protein